MAEKVETSHAFHVISQGFSAQSGPRASSLWMDGVLVQQGGRSYNLAVYNRWTVALESVGTYDICGNPQHAASLAAKLNTLNSDQLFFLYTQDEPRDHKDEGGLPAAMARVGGGRFLRPFQYRSAYLLIGIADKTLQANVVEKYAGTIESDPSAACDVDVVIKNGTIVTIAEAVREESENNRIHFAEEKKDKEELLQKIDEMQQKQQEQEQQQKEQIEKLQQQVQQLDTNEKRDKEELGYIVALLLAILVSDENGNGKTQSERRHQLQQLQQRVAALQSATTSTAPK